MKRLSTLILLSILLIQGIVAQNNNLVVYSQEGLKFTIILNGIRQNPQPETNVKVTNLNAPNYQTKIIFANNMADINQNVYLTNGAETTNNTEFTYSIVNVKGKYKLRFKSIAPVSSVVETASLQQTVVVYTPVAVSNTTTTTSTTTTNSGNPTGENIGVNMNGTGINININSTSPSNSNSTSTTSYSTTTTTTTTGAGNPNNTSPGNNNYVLPGYSGVYGCRHPMSSVDFESAKQSIKSKGFDESRLILAKQIIGNNCLLCSQIKELMGLMSFEETKLELAKFAWHHNLDKGNYYKLNDAFSFESSIEELNNYTQSH
ncbi:MAG: hypothetical protein A3F72_10265 [Bacteroidetes bacterium RIFCSPLOWO2_12_FULL_35_15]|nr:MAG: hypothetical protein A3F72_10265 [Bacteroidetes bacterium RIFCSPLOWO2_12_FULL_35_15]